MRTALALLVSTAFTGPARADNNELAFSESTRALRASSANAVTRDSLVGGGVQYARRLPIAFDPLDVWAYASFDWGGAEGTLFQTLTTDLATLGGSAGLRAHYDVWRERIVASVRVDLGVVRAALEIRDAAGNLASDHGWGATSRAAAGVELVAIRRRKLSLGLRLELGAVATSSIPLTAIPAQPSENMLVVDGTAASLGRLNLSGPWFAASVVGRF